MSRKTTFFKEILVLEVTLKTNCHKMLLYRATLNKQDHIVFIAKDN